MFSIKDRPSVCARGGGEQFKNSQGEGKKTIKQLLGEGKERKEGFGSGVGQGSHRGSGGGKWSNLWTEEERVVILTRISFQPENLGGGGVVD